MTKILFINACVRPASRTLELAKHILKNLSDGEAVVETVDLYSIPLSPLNLDGMKKRDLSACNQDFSDEAFSLAKQFSLADIIVIAAPYWDLMFPSVLKTYFEAITVSGITFSYSNEGRPVSLCRASKLFYITTSGGFIGNNNFGFAYTKALAENFYGISDANINCFVAEGLDISPDKANDILQIAKENADTFFENNK